MSYNSIHNTQIIFKVNNKSTKKKSKDLTKISKQHDRPCCGIPVVKETFVCRVDVPSIFKNIRIRKTIINVNLKKSLRQISHPVTDLKMELAVKIVNDFKNC